MSYRELAERLHITRAAARKKAKRKAEAGSWRIIPGNHPADLVLIEVPVADLDVPAPVAAPQDQALLPAPTGTRPFLAESTHDRADEQAIFITGLLAAQHRIEELTNQIQEAHAAHLKTAAELTARIEALSLDVRAEKNAHLSTASELGQKLRLAQSAHVTTSAELGEKLRAAQDAHFKDAAALIVAETRMFATASELDRARREIDALRRSWWRRLVGR